MKYAIRIYYADGDTFKTEDKESVLDGYWENENIIRENLTRIKEHYIWYISKDNRPYRGSIKPERPSWHTKDIPEHSVKLILDNGNEYICSAFWCGYFASLQGAKAEVYTPDDLQFEL